MNVKALYFSPTGTTKKIVHKIAEKVNSNLNPKDSVNFYDFTLPNFRDNAPQYTESDVVIVGVPVYAGRVPNILLKYLSALKGEGALAIAVVLYGNRNYDDALIELKDILEQQKFSVAAAGAFVGEHSFSKTLAKGRPNLEDLQIAENFADSVSTKILNGSFSKSIEVRGTKPYRPYYKPKDENSNPVDIRKVVPKTDSKCIDCKLCAKICPMGSISFENVDKLIGICIKCGSCIKKCPVGAKYYDDKDYLRHKIELELEYAENKYPEVFF